MKIGGFVFNIKNRVEGDSGVNRVGCLCSGGAADSPSSEIDDCAEEKAQGVCALSVLEFCPTFWI